MLDSPETGAHTPHSLIRELAHELRDALSPLASCADLARLRNFDPETSRLLVQKVERSLRRALATLDSFVLAEQCEAGTLQLAVASVALGQILQGARSALGETRPERYMFDSADTGIMVQGDSARSAQLLAAVLQHAAAIASRESVVEVSAGATAAQTHIRVRGLIEPGNSPGEDWFAGYRGGEGRMALRTARQIMELQGGGLDLVTSNDGEFELVLRFAGPPAPAEEQRRQELRGGRVEPAGGSAAARAPGGRILIVDDSREVRRAYREALLALDYSVAEAADAEQALNALEGARPDIALIDIHLPRMNGYRLAQAIRARAGSAIYLVMLSGMALDAVTRGLAREAGFDDCLDKMAGPIALRELLGAAESQG